LSPFDVVYKAQRPFRLPVWGVSSPTTLLAATFEYHQGCVLIIVLLSAFVNFRAEQVIKCFEAFGRLEIQISSNIFNSLVKLPFQHLFRPKMNFPQFGKRARESSFSFVESNTWFFELIPKAVSSTVYPMMIHMTKYITIVVAHEPMEHEVSFGDLFDNFSKNDHTNDS
jgi:hypothetical protein